MSETSDKPASVELNSKKDSLSYYASLLGLDQRRYPKKEEMPTSVFLPPEVLGDLKDNILLTGKDGIERSQFVDWDFVKRKPNKAKILVGNTENTGVAHARQSALRAYIGGKALLTSHTHPEGRGVTGTWMFSPGDIADSFRYPRLAFISGVGAMSGASFLFQAEGSQRLPLFSEEIYEKVETKITENFDLKFVAKYLADRNLIFYRWSPEGDGLKGEMTKKGMWLNKVNFN